MKEIKDYLHLYLGCDCMLNVEPGESPKRFRLTYYNLNYYRDYFYDVIPILRPLSDMTEEEMFTVIDIGGLMYAGGGPKAFTQGWTAYSGENFIYLLKQGFDLFGLIESGLSIDKTKQKTLTK